LAEASAVVDRPPPAADPPGRPFRTRRVNAGTALGLGVATLWLSLLVLIPLGAVIWRANEKGTGAFWDAVAAPEAASAIKLTVAVALVVSLINVVFGTLIAWVLVRDDFHGKRFLDALIDLPFALPTIVAGLVLLALYGVNSPVGVELAYTRAGVMMALLFVTLPFVVRTVQPVLLELDRDAEEAAASLGAGKLTTFRRIVLPNLVPAIAAGTALSFARAMSEFGATVLISGNLPFKTQVASVHIYNQIQSDNTLGAAAVATILLAISLVVLLGLDLIQRWAVRRG